MDGKDWERLKANPFAREWTPTEEDDGTEVVFYEERTLVDGRTLRIPVPDVIITLTHPLNGTTVTGPSQVLGSIWSRWDFITGHIEMAAHIERAMSEIEHDMSGEETDDKR